jgi:hypothetical protein
MDRSFAVPVHGSLEMLNMRTGSVLGSSPEGLRTGTGPDIKALVVVGHCGAWQLRV